MRLEVLTESPHGTPKATPLLFVHGAWHAAWCWQEHFLGYFARLGYSCHALSLRGHGASADADRLRWTSLSDYVADVAQVARDLPRPPVIIAHSMGGLIVQKFIERHVVPGVVLLASVPPSWGAIPATARVARRHPLEFLKVILSLSMYPLVSTPRLARSAFFSDSMPAEQVSAYAARLQDESFRGFLGMLGLELPRARHGRTAMLVLGGASDAIISEADIEHTARAYGGTKQVFPDMAHDMMLESGWEGVAQRIAAWLIEQRLSG